MLTKLNVLKFIVLIGTFALAMAFAGNDLVNFIGVPLAGYESFNAWMANPGADPGAFLMTDLTGKVGTPTLFLLIAGLIMVVTLWTSKKSRSVTKTEINLARQDAGYERFHSSGFSRSIVRGSSNFAKITRTLIPESILNKIEKQFDQIEYQKQQAALGVDAPHFDMIRASVNLVVASILISFATSLKLPLSTTYVTFMVAMGTSLSDRAWGRESAVYRISGVISVIGGWFFTAFAAFSAAFIIAAIIKYGGFIAIIILIALAIFFVFKTHLIHKKRSAEEEEEAEEDLVTAEKIVEKCSDNVTNLLGKFSGILNASIVGLINEDLKLLRKSNKDVEKINKKTKKLKNNISETIASLEESSIDTGHYYVQVLDYLREMAHSISYINKPCLDHVDNNHKSLIKIQVEELTDLTKRMSDFIKEITQILQDQDYSRLNIVLEQQVEIIKLIDAARKLQVKRIKANEVGTRNSILYLGILSESKNLVLQVVNVAKAHRDFNTFVNGQGV